MFKPGTHIKIVASSKRKGTGPRRGSLGFIKWADNIAQIEDGCVMVTLEAVFYRFGFEERFRNETKQIAAILPAKQIVSGDTGAEMRSLLRRVSNKKYENWQTKMRNTSSSAALAIVKPTFGLNLLDCPSEVYSTWARSVLSASEFGYHIGKASITGHITRSPWQVFDQEALNAFQRSQSDPEFREDIIAAATALPMSRKLLLERVRFVDSAVGPVANSNSLDYFRSVFGGMNPPPSTDQFVNAAALFAPVMFKTPQFSEGLEIARRGIAEGTLKNQSINAMEQVESIREWVLGLSD